MELAESLAQRSGGVGSSLNVFLSWVWALLCPDRAVPASWAVWAASGTPPGFGGGIGGQDTAHSLWVPGSQQLTWLLLSPVLRSGRTRGSTP